MAKKSQARILVQQQQKYLPLLNRKSFIIFKAGIGGGRGGGLTIKRKSNNFSIPISPSSAILF